MSQKFHIFMQMIAINAVIYRINCNQITLKFLNCFNLKLLKTFNFHLKKQLT